MSDGSTAWSVPKPQGHATHEEAGAKRRLPTGRGQATGKDGSFPGRALVVPSGQAEGGGRLRPPSKGAASGASGASSNEAYEASQPIAVGDRVSALVPGAASSSPSMRGPTASSAYPDKGREKDKLLGTVRFIGQVEGRPGEWIGVELDEPLGKNDGSARGVRYFECAADYGIFCRRDSVQKIEPDGAKDRRSRGRAQTADAAPTANGGAHASARKRLTADGASAARSPHAASTDVGAATTSIGAGCAGASNDEGDGSGSSASSSASRASGSRSSSSCGLSSIRVDAGGDGVLDSPELEERGAWWKKVDEMAYRGIRLAFILSFYQRLAEGSLRDARGNALLPHFDPLCHTTNDVVRQAIVPISRSTPFGDCAYSVLVEGNRPMLATVMVSHHWRNLFCHLVAAMVAFALGKTTYDDVVEDLREHRFEELRVALDKRDALQMPFWGCLFCVNQHVSICGSLPSQPSKDTPDYERVVAHHYRETHDPVTDELFSTCSCTCEKHWNDSEDCEMDKFDAMMAILGKEAPKVAQRLHHVIVVDQSFEVFSRIWVMAEIAKGQELELSQIAMLYSGSANLPAEEIERVRNLDVRQCTASRQEDVEAILAAIPDVDRFNENLRNVLFNKQTGLLETWSAERCAGFFDVIDPVKGLFADIHTKTPTVVTIGQESTGKSTLMERLTGAPIFPRDADLCTRSIIKVRLRRGPAEDAAIFVEDLATGQQEKSATVQRDEIGAAVLKEMTRQVRLEAFRKEKGVPNGAEKDDDLDGPLTGADGICTTKLVAVELTSPTSPNLDIVDCPGLVAARSRGRPADVVQTTAELVRRYASEMKGKALFIVTVKASEQPNNSLGMQLVQDLGLEDCTLGVLTMADVLTGDIMDESSKLQKSFAKLQGPRLMAILRNEDDSGGAVHLGLGYVLTALNDVCETKGWSSYSRIDAMAHWEQLFFMELARQWSDVDEDLDLGLLQENSTCNGVWKHVKAAVDDFVRNHWLVDVFQKVNSEDTAIMQKVAALGTPPGLHPDHRGKLRLASDHLPGNLGAATQLDDETIGSADTTRSLFARKTNEALEKGIEDLSAPGGRLESIMARLDADLLAKVPERLISGAAGSAAVDPPRLDPAAGAAAATTPQPAAPPRFDVMERLDGCLSDLEDLVKAAVLELNGILVASLGEALNERRSSERLGRFGVAIPRILAEVTRWANAMAESTSVPTALGIAPGCGLSSTGWVRMERGPGFAVKAQVAREQIQCRCVLLLHEFLAAVQRDLPSAVTEACLSLPEDAWTEDCSAERFELLSYLQEVRLTMARLKDAFADEVRQLAEQQSGAAPANEDAKGARMAAVVSMSKYRRRTQTKINGTSKDVKEVASTWRSRRNREASYRRRTAEEVAQAVRRWRDVMPTRARKQFDQAGLEQVLAEFASNTESGDDLTACAKEKCVRWHGPVSPDGLQAMLHVIRPGQREASAVHANRLVAFLFAADELFERLERLPKEPFTMTCGDQLCINVAHISTVARRLASSAE